MDSEMHFGEVEQKPTGTRLRPDRNGQLALARVQTPGPGDLPIFVDLDVMREMWNHACSDRRVELGGVLLGGQYEDEQGEPFVVVADCLRARHYESTKGSFKFTHDTWEQITRDRGSLPPDLHMVGWYHTHPGWGVFLSGMDLFICDHFFNKPLDVALVLDPCQTDTGFFQWTVEGDERIRRTGGYSIFTTRFRSDELNRFVAELEGQLMSPPMSAAQVPMLIQSPPPPPPPLWQLLVVMTMLSLQFGLLLLVAARLLPTGFGDGQGDPQLAELRDGLQRIEAARQQESDIDAKLQVLELVLRQGTDAPEGVLNRLAERTQEVQQLEGSLRGQQSLTRELDSRLTELQANVASIERKSQSEIAALQTKLERAEQALANARDQLTQRETTSVQVAASEGGWQAWVGDRRALGLGALLGASLVGAASFAVMRRQGLLVQHPEPVNEQS